MPEHLFPDGLTDDALLNGRLRLMQPVGGYRVAVDPILLAAGIRARPGDRVADLGCGAGVVSLCLAARVAGCRVVGLERERDLAALADANIAANGAADRVQVVCGDVAHAPLAEGSFDHVALNPPFLPARQTTPPANRLRQAAAVEGAAGLDTWLDTAMALLRPGGEALVLHRADRLDHILAILAKMAQKGRGGSQSVLPIWPKAGRPAKRVFVRCRKGDRRPFMLLPGLVLHETDGSFTQAAEKVLRDCAALDETAASL